MFQEKEEESENGVHRYISNAADCDDRMQEREIHLFFSCSYRTQEYVRIERVNKLISKDKWCNAGIESKPKQNAIYMF